MKVIKPQRLGLLPRAFEHGNDCFLSLTIAAFFPLDNASVLLPEVALWKMVAEELGRSSPLDEGLPKQRGELLVCGKAFPPGGAAKIACQVRVRVGPVDKMLRVMGNRRWERGGAPSVPEPFTEMPLTYAQAFGGPGCASNPLGKGLAPLNTPQGPVHPLPNVEDPRQLIRSPKDRPAPAGFLPYDVGWPQRMSRAGTYDSRWLKTRFPGFAEDMQGSYFNTAPEDQWLPGFFTGGERFLLENLHPSKPRIEGELPRLTARAFISQKTAEGEVLRELSTRLDTVWLFPHVMRGVLLFRALARVAEDDASDVLRCMVGVEAQGAPRPAGHYEEVLARRLDKQQGHLYALRDDELLPAAALASGASAEDASPEFEVAGTALTAAMRRRAERERERLREAARQAGVDPDSISLPPLPEDAPVPTLEELPAFVARAEAEVEAQKAAAERQRAEMEQELRRICAENGIDFEKMMADGQRGGPPRFSAREELAKLEQLVLEARSLGAPQPELEALVADPAFVARLVNSEAQLRDAYRRFGHHFPPAAPLPPAESGQVRALVEAHCRQGQSLAGADLTGADLSGLRLAGMDLSGALMERASLQGADLSGANLSGALLARADLSGARLTGANLRDANLGRALLGGAQLEGGVDLSGATLSGADLRGTNLTGARLEGADLSEAQLGRVVLRDVLAAGTVFLRNDLSDAVLTGADLTGCTFLECSVAGADFSGATLTAAVFLAAKGEGALFRQVKARNLRMVQDCAFQRADFQGAELAESNLRGSQLEAANLTGAVLDRADLSGCNLRQARLYRAVARDSRWVRADLEAANLTAINLMGAILQKANITEADFTGANLFRGDFAKVKGKARSMRDALLTEVRIIQREPA